MNELAPLRNVLQCFLHEQHVHIHRRMARGLAIHDRAMTMNTMTTMDTANSVQNPSGASERNTLVALVVAAAVVVAVVVVNGRVAVVVDVTV